ncbi:MAG TPA: hypothetical protein PKD45_13535 [Flavobacteriales bacterium]|nr:hypothetical protein [Flavobacteriales bacterium]
MKTLLSIALALGSCLLHAQQWNWAVSGGGTSNDDQCYAIGMDSQGNVYYGGTSRGSNGQFACGPVDMGATTGGVLAKYSPDGQCLWLRTITVPSFDARVYAIAIDHEDRIYVAGSYRGTATFSDGITLASYSSSTTIFLARYDTAGICLWACRAGGNSSTNIARGLALSDSGDVFLVGKAGGNPVRAGDLEMPNPGNAWQVFMARYDSTGTVQWARISTGAGSNGDKIARSISIQGDRLFVTGKAEFTEASYGGLPLTHTPNTGSLFVMACDLQGNALWTRPYGGLGQVEGTGIAADSLGNLFVSASLFGRIFLDGDTISAVPGNDDILLLGLDQDGGHRWAHTAGSTERDLAWAITADGMGNAYAAIQFEGTMELLGQPITALGGEDALILKLRDDGTPVWTSRPSGYQRDIPLCIYRQPSPPHHLAFGGYFWGTITYGGSTISDIQNGDGMLVMGTDTTFAVNVHTTPTCPDECNGTSTVFTNGEGPFQFEWADGGSDPVRTGQCPGDIDLAVTDANGQLVTLTSTVHPEADPGLSVQVLEDSLWVDGGMAWQWFLNGTPLAEADTSFLVAQVTGAYHAEYTGPNGCGWSTDTVLVVLGVGIQGPPLQQPHAFPVPATDRVEVIGLPPVHSARAWDMSGRQHPVQWSAPNVFLINDWAPGLWVVELLTEDGQRFHVRMVKADR